MHDADVRCTQHVRVYIFIRVQSIKHERVHVKHACARESACVHAR